MPETNYFKPSFAVSYAFCLGIVVSFRPFTSSAFLFDCLQVWNVFCVPISKLVFQGVVESIQTVFIILIVFSVLPSISKCRSQTKSLNIRWFLARPKWRPFIFWYSKTYVSPKYWRIFAKSDIEQQRPLNSPRSDMWPAKFLFSHPKCTS